MSDMTMRDVARTTLKATFAALIAKSLYDSYQCYPLLEVVGKQLTLKGYIFKGKYVIRLTTNNYGQLTYANLVGTGTLTSIVHPTLKWKSGEPVDYTRIVKLFTVQWLAVADRDKPLFLQVLENVHNEVRVLKRYGKGDHLLKYHGSYITEARGEVLAYIIQEFIGGKAYAYGGSREELDTVYNLIDELYYLHRTLKLLHYDLHKGNVMMQSWDKKVRIIDYGSTYKVDERPQFGDWEEMPGLPPGTLYVGRGRVMGPFWIAARRDFGEMMEWCEYISGLAWRRKQFQAHYSRFSDEDIEKALQTGLAKIGKSLFSTLRRKYLWHQPDVDLFLAWYNSQTNNEYDRWGDP